MTTPFAIAQILLDSKAVKVSLNPPFQWTSGMKSPVYCDNRILPSFPNFRDLIVDGFVNLIQKHNFQPDAIGGTATAGIPWAAFVAQKMNLPMFYVRPKPKEHGEGKQIEGVIKSKSKIIMIEDLFSTGGSAIKAAQACEKEAQTEVLGIFSIVTYGFPIAEKSFAQAGYLSDSLTSFDSILALLKQQSVFSPDDLEKIAEFIDNPENWGKNMGLI